MIGPDSLSSPGVEVPAFISAHSRIQSRAPFALRASKPGVRDEEGSKDRRHRTGWCRGTNQRMSCALLLPGLQETGAFQHPSLKEKSMVC